jgi:cbb3-type cytochrome oxidase subunit 1
MPPLTRRFIKIAMLYLLAALLAGLGPAVRSLWPLPPFLAALGPVYFHLFMVGWVAQLIFGVVYWMFPKYSQARPHGSEGVWQAIFWLLNVGLLMRVVAEPMLTLTAGPGWGWGVALSAVMQWAAGMLFVFNTWPRVKAR